MLISKKNGEMHAMRDEYKTGGLREESLFRGWAVYYAPCIQVESDPDHSLQSASIPEIPFIHS